MEHWILLEDDEAYTKGAARHTTGLTDLSVPPRPLTAKQLAAVRVVFGDLLAWPPRSEPQVLLVQQAARALEISPSGVQERLGEVVRRARELGLTRQHVALTDPEYIHLLVRAGYLEPSAADLHRPLLRTERTGPATGYPATQQDVPDGRGAVFSNHDEGQRPSADR